MNHIAFVIPGLDQIGGAERQMLDLAEGLAARGWRISVIALSGDGRAGAERLRSAHIPFQSLAMRKGLADPRGWLRIHRCIQHLQPDVIHAHLPHAAFLARWSRLLAPSRVLIDTVHTSAIGGFGRQLGYRLTNWLPDRMTIVGDAAARIWTKRGRVKPGATVVIPNGIATVHWKPDAEARAAVRAQLGLTGQFVWLTAGRLEPVKNHRVLLEAMALLPPSAHLFIAGSGSLQTQLRRQASSLGLEDRIRFLGFVPDLLPFLQAADGVALASRWEGLPIALMEAAACALPAVATSVPGSREAILPGQTGYLCSPEDPAELAASMQHVMQMTPEERRAMGGRARQRIIAHFDLDSVLDRWETLYTELLADRPLPMRWARCGQASQRSAPGEDASCDVRAAAESPIAPALPPPIQGGVRSPPAPPARTP